VHNHTYANKSENLTTSQQDTTNETTEHEENEGYGEDEECCSTSDECLLAIGVQKLVIIVKLCLSGKQLARFGEGHQKAK